MTESRREVAKAENLDPERTFAKFIDYWKSASGAKARKVDWEATWRNWCRTEADRRSPPTNGHREPESVITWRPPVDRGVEA